ncbi:MAG: VOC family protein [Rhizobiaceae bacterium]
MSARALDHLVLPVAGLGAARSRLGQLGFTLAPDGVHPFGTVNACVYFADGTFIEPLATGDAAAIEAATAAGNSFVLSDRRFRARRAEGLSALVLATDDAEADHARFAMLDVSGGPMLEFSRPSLDRDGKADTATFRLAFASPDGGADAFFFVCERRKVPAIDRSALERHANGATTIAEVRAEAADPHRFAAFLATLSGGATSDGDGFVEVALANATVRILRKPDARAPRLTAIVYGVRDLAVTAALLQAGAIACRRREGRLHVPAAEGQGVEFMFEEMP